MESATALTEAAFFEAMAEARKQTTPLTLRPTEISWPTACVSYDDERRLVKRVSVRTKAGDLVSRNFAPPIAIGEARKIGDQMLAELG